MYKLTVKPKKSQLTSVELLEGETIEQKVERLVANNEPIKDGAPEIFTERKDGVISAYNIRADRWEIATEAMEKVNKSRIAKRDEVGKPMENDATKKDVKDQLKKDAINGDSGAKSTEGKNPTK